MQSTQPQHTTRTDSESRPTRVENDSLAVMALMAATPPAVVAAATWPVFAAAFVAVALALALARATAPTLARRYAGHHASLRVPGADLKLEVAVSDPATGPPE